MKTTSQKVVSRIRRHVRIRAKLSGTAVCPRLAVFRSNRSIYAQLIDDEAGKTLAAADSRKAKGKTSRERAGEVGTTIASLAKGKGIEKIVFDRGGFQYKGSIKELAEAARKAGLQF